MKSLLKMTWMEAKLFVREPVNAFFTLLFPIIMLFIFGTIYGTTPPPNSGMNPISALIPTFAAMVIGMTGLMSITITLATYRENGVLRRLGTTPVSPLVVMGAQVAVVFVMTCLGVDLLVLAGKFFYHVSLTGNILSMFGGLVLSSISFFGLGFILAGLLPNARTAQIVAMVILYPMLILSGAAWPKELMPGVMAKITSIVPLTYVVNFLRGLWAGDSWAAHSLDILVLVVMLLVGIIVSLRTFRWE